MLSGREKKNVIDRLRRVEGQVAAIRRMVEEDAYCVDILIQVSAAQAALGKAGHRILGNHIESCVADAFTSGSKGDRQKKIEELMEVFSRYARLPAP